MSHCLLSIERQSNMSSVASSPLLKLHPEDNIAIARNSVAENQTCAFSETESVTTREDIDLGHKVAIQQIAKGAPIRKFGQLIGFATSDIEPGDWIHGHNLEAGKLSLDYAYSSDVPAAPKPIEGRTFMGYRRPNGKAGTRNYLAIISTVNCSATASKYIAQELAKTSLADYPNIDGIIPLVHKGGCAMQYDGEDHHQLMRTLGGFAKHPNIGAYVVLGLGCELVKVHSSLIRKASFS